MYRTAWKIEHGFANFTDEQCDYWWNVLRERAQEEREWTPRFFQKLFNIRTAKSAQARKGMDKEDVRERASVVALLSSRGIDHRVVGGNAIFCCPLHGERNPSASFSIKKKVWYCFSGCSTGGDIFDFLMRLEGISFAQAVQELSTCT